jgi:DNA-binding MarR family transcriptional regulator
VLTAEGRRVLGEIEVASRAYFDAIFERMAEEDVVQLVSLLQKLADTAAVIAAEAEAM